jgi:hypothetical protein
MCPFDFILNACDYKYPPARREINPARLQMEAGCGFVDFHQRVMNIRSNLSKTKIKQKQRSMVHAMSTVSYGHFKIVSTFGLN